MSGIYLHIPFCKQACHYCDFHFSTSIKKKGAMVNALCKELLLRKEEVTDTVQTIYFGGGTPSLLTSEELEQIFETIFENFTVAPDAEITLEANPDDLTKTRIETLAKSPINRLSIGVQSFFEADLTLMNRAHNEKEAFTCIEEAKKQFHNISIDLIYGIPGMTNNRWKHNLHTAISLNIPHLSCYALTVEPRTALKKFIEKGIIPPVEDAVAETHYKTLLAETENAGFENYEFSNFGKPGYYSRNNTAYWQGKPYLGIGPSAHGFDGTTRRWNVANNTKYIQAITAGELPQEQEALSVKDRYNEYIMTGLRTKWGVSLNKLEDSFGKNYKEYALSRLHHIYKKNLLFIEDNTLKVSKKGKFLSDGIASDLFLTD